MRKLDNEIIEFIKKVRAENLTVEKYVRDQYTVGYCEKYKDGHIREWGKTRIAIGFIAPSDAKRKRICELAKKILGKRIMFCMLKENPCSNVKVGIALSVSERYKAHIPKKRWKHYDFKD